MFSLAQEQRLKAISVPSSATFSRIREMETENEEKFRAYINAAAEFGPKLKKESSRAMILESQIQQHKKQLQNTRRKLSKSPVPSSEPLLNVSADVPSQVARTSQKCLTPEQLADIRDKFVYNFRYISSKHLFRPIPARNGPSLERDLASKVQKSQRLSIRETALKEELVTLARSFEKTVVTKDSSKIILNAIPHHVSEAVSSEYSKRLGAVKARVSSAKEEKKWQMKQAKKCKEI